MTPSTFGRDGQTLVGLYHSPRPSVARDAAVLLCAPIGQEYMRTHRPMRRVALQLAEAGLHVLRFDYYGTGDSAGDMSEAGVELWLDDIRRAAAELLDISGAKDLTAIGLRSGALLAATACARGWLEVKRLVLWDPVVRGKEYLAELKQMHEEMVRSLRPVPSDEILGYSYTHVLRRELEDLDLGAAAAGLRAERVDLLVSRASPALDGLEAALRAGGKLATVLKLEEDGLWDVFPKAFTTMLAGKTVQAVATLVTG